MTSTISSERNPPTAASPWRRIAAFFVDYVVFVVPLLGVLGLVGWTLLSLEISFPSNALVTTGPYRYVRHPFYLAFFVAVIGGSIVAANWFVLLAGLVPSGFLIARTRIEEEKLVERFGDEYRTYMKQVGQFFPKIL